MQTLDLKATTREGTGKSVTRKLRVQGLVPATLYGLAAEPLSLNVEADDFDTLYKGRGTSNFILNLTIDEGEPTLTIVRERQRHPVSRAILHVDFQRISMDKPIYTKVPIRLTGEAPGVKTDGGILEHLLREVAISCLPKFIPDQFTVDISEMHINDSVHLSDLDMPDVTVEGEISTVIVNVSPPRLSTLDEDAEGEDAEGEEGAEGAEGEDAEGSDEGDA
jgi:large subunit ribosomal protein L25